MPVFAKSTAVVFSPVSHRKLFPEPKLLESSFHSSKIVFRKKQTNAKPKLSENLTEASSAILLLNIWLIKPAPPLPQLAPSSRRAFSLSFKLRASCREEASIRRPSTGAALAELSAKPQDTISNIRYKPTRLNCRELHIK